MSEKHHCELNCRVCLPNEWISVKDRLPEKCYNIHKNPLVKQEKILLFNGDDIFTGFYRKDEEGPYFFDLESMDEAKAVSHWMSMPEPPSE